MTVIMNSDAGDGSGGNHYRAHVSTTDVDYFVIQCASQHTREQGMTPVNSAL